MTKETDYGILVLACFARMVNQNHPLTTKSISEQTGISYRMVCKVLNLLTRKQLLVSQRGIKGGYALSRSAEEITLHEAIQALEGPLALTECSREVCECQAKTSCITKGHWYAINLAFQKALNGITIAAMASQKSLPMFIERK